MDIELFHGAVLTRLIRKDRPISLNIIEFNADKSRSGYILTDDDGDKPLYIKHSKGSALTPKGYKKSWQFTFSEEHLKEIQELFEDYGHVNIVLVCGAKTIGAEDTYTALLSYDKLEQCVDITGNNGQQIVNIGDKGGKNYLRVWGSKIFVKKSFGLSESKLNEL